MKSKLLFLLLLLLTLGLQFAELIFGSVSIPWNELFLAENAPIVIDIRLLKMIVAVIAGVALSVSGLQMQTLFSNPLAGPYVLGLSSGASLGVALVLLGGAVGPFGIAGAALCGSGVVMLLLLGVNSRVRDGMSLLILGIMFSSAVGAIVQILQFLSRDAALKSYVVWTMGSLGEVTWPQLWILVGIIVVGLIIAVVTVKDLNLMMFGPVLARSMGLDLRRSRALILLSTTLLAGGITAFCGPIGFIGMAVPHIARGLFRSADSRILLPASALLGADILLACDLISRLFVLPINSITSLVGIPVVIYVILRK
ncbi:MAG: iron ABC transporter permease [Muribaculaceae bacterium]|nr:iron ABC transporter permease [Muribaculaceae bacterium]